MSLFIHRRRLPEPACVVIRAGRPIEFHTGRARPALRAVVVVIVLFAMTFAGLFI